MSNSSILHFVLWNSVMDQAQEGDQKCVSKPSPTKEAGSSLREEKEFGWLVLFLFRKWLGHKNFLWYPEPLLSYYHESHIPCNSVSTSSLLASMKRHLLLWEINFNCAFTKRAIFSSIHFPNGHVEKSHIKTYKSIIANFPLFIQLKRSVLNKRVLIYFINQQSYITMDTPGYKLY